MLTDRHNSRKWEIFLGVVFVVSVLGVTLVLTIKDVIAAPEKGNFAITTTSDQTFLT